MLLRPLWASHLTQQLNVLVHDTHLAASANVSRTFFGSDIWLLCHKEMARLVEDDAQIGQLQAETVLPMDRQVQARLFILNVQTAAWLLGNLEELYKCIVKYPQSRVRPSTYHRPPRQGWAQWDST